MSEEKKRKKFDGRPIAFCVLSFFAGACLFLLALCISLRVTFLSPDYMTATMADGDYYNQVQEEYRKQLDSLGHASGLNSEFTNAFVAELDVRQDITNYVEAFYSGSSTVLNKTPFKQKFRAEVDEFAEQNKKEGTEPDDAALEYLTNEAANLYSDAVEIPFFAVVANFIHNLTTPVTAAVIVLLAAVLIMIAVMFFGNRPFMHRGYRYTSYALITAAICTAVLPAIITFTDIVSKVNITTWSLYNLFVNYFTGIVGYLWVFAGIYLFLGVVFFALFASKHNKLLKH